VAVKLFTTADYVSLSTTGLTANTWFTLDVSASVSADATGAILYISTTNPSVNKFKVRKKGSTDNWPSTIQGGFFYVGLDALKRLEVYCASTSNKPTIRLAGYFEGEAVFFDNAIDFSMASMSNNAWNDVNIASSTGGDTAIAAIVAVTVPDVDNGASDYLTLGFRKNGSTWNQPVANLAGFSRTSPGGTLVAAPDYGSTYHIVPVDASEIFEVYRSLGGGGFGTYGTVRLIGYVTSGLTLSNSPTNFTKPSSTGYAPHFLSRADGVFLVARKAVEAASFGTGTPYAGIYPYCYQIPLKADYNSGVYPAIINWHNVSSGYDIGEYLYVDPAPVAPSAGSLTLTGKVPTIEATTDVNVPKGSLAFSGKVPAINTGTQVAPPKGELAFTPRVPAINTGASASPATSALALLGYAPFIDTPVQVDAPLGTLALTPGVPNVGTGVINDVIGNFLLLEADDSIASTGASVAPPVAALLLDAPVPLISSATSVNPDAGVLAFTSLAPNVGAGVTIEMDPGILKLTPKAPNIQARPRTWIAALNGRNIEEVFVILITLSHPNLTDDIRIASDNRDTLTTGRKGVISNDKEFTYIPFSITLPNLERDILPAVRTSIDNVSREIVAVLSTLTSAPYARVQVALSTDPDIVEYDLQGLRFTDTSFNELTIDGIFSAEFYFLEPYAAVRFTPSRFPGLFRGRNVPASV